ncbi:hypothetical protein KA119_02225 [Candidatus Gracilibacteria bacterium]|nr:hypothetical protein [Candidatus Gracilibacteria bacterium]
MPKKVQDPTKELVAQLQILTKQVQNLRDSELVEIFKKPGKFLWFSFLKGLALGLGSALGATILLAFLIYLLAQIQLVPYIGDFVTEVIQEIER